MQVEKENDVIKRCSFKPEINEGFQTNRSITPIDESRKGFNRYIERAQHESVVTNQSLGTSS